MCFALLKRCRYSDNLRRLPEQVLMEIMLNVNASDLQNLKSTCKFWNTFISDPDFVKLHFNHSRSQKQPQILFESVVDPTNLNPRYEYYHFGIDIRNNTICKSDFQFRGDGKGLAFKASCDGLLLLQDKYNAKQLYISNPATFKLEPLPLTNVFSNDWALVFDTRIQKYKVFAIRCRYLYTILTLGEKNASWKCYDEEPWKRRSSNDGVLSNVVFVNKELHWLTTEVQVEYSPTNTQLHYFIFSIHVQECKFTMTRVPLRCYSEDIRVLERCYGKHLLSDVNGLLCLTFVSHNQLKISVLEDKEKGLWTKFHVIRLQSLSEQTMLSPTFLNNDTCLVAKGGVANSNLDDLVKLLVHVEDKLFLYDLKTQESTLVGLLSKERKLHRCYFSHSESLISWASNTA